MNFARSPLPPSSRIFTGLAVLAAFLWLTPPCVAAETTDPLFERAQRVRQRAPLGAKTRAERVVVKFHEGLGVRLRDQRLQGLDTDPSMDALALAGDLAKVHQIVSLDSRAQTLSRLLARSETALADQKRTAENKTGKTLEDLNLFFQIELEADTRAGDVENLIQALHSIPSVAYAYLQAPAINAGLPAAAGGTPDFLPLQGYLEPAPGGIDAFYSWTVAGGRGAGVKIVDVERGVNPSHEDFPTFCSIDNSVSPLLADRNHGTAVVGEMVGQDNGFGITGISSDAEIGFASWFGQSPTTGIDEAIGIAGPGGIVLIEIQIQGPPNTQVPCPACTGNQCHFVPTEWDPATFAVIEMATANGTHVVEAGGNGGTDLDDPAFMGAFDRAQQDSGAILVAASRSIGREPTCWTNHGSRIDLHAWGENIVTTGYGDLQGGIENHWYTEQFGGTSGASPMVASSAANLLGAALANGQGAMSPGAIRQLLATTGTPQNAPVFRRIGPMPDLRDALDELLIQQNLPPVAQMDVLPMKDCTQSRDIRGSELIVNDTDPDQDSLTVCNWTQPVYGQASPSPSALFFYSPGSEMCTLGSDWFTYTINDRSSCLGLSDVALAMIVSEMEGATLFEDFFENGAPTGWNSTFVNGGNEIEVVAPGLAGLQGLEVSLTGAGNVAFLESQHMAGDTQYAASFLLDPNGMTVTAPFNVLVARTGTDLAFVVRLRHNAGTYQAQIRAWSSDGVVQNSSWFDLVDGVQRLSLEWWQPGGVPDGGLSLHINGQLATRLIRIGNAGMKLAKVRLGATGVQAGTTGSLLFDDFRSSEGNGLP